MASLHAGAGSMRLPLCICGHTQSLPIHTVLFPGDEQQHPGHYEIMKFYQSTSKAPAKVLQSLKVPGCCCG